MFGAFAVLSVSGGGELCGVTLPHPPDVLPKATSDRFIDIIKLPFRLVNLWRLEAFCIMRHAHHELAFDSVTA